MAGRIRVRSIVGRFLEHSRIFYFEIEDAKGACTKRIWLSSADWMSRNMMRRIEIAWPIAGAEMQTRIMQECLMPYLADTEDAWLQQASGKYIKPSNAHGINAQKILIKKYEADQ